MHRTQYYSHQAYRLFEKRSAQTRHVWPVSSLELLLDRGLFTLCVVEAYYPIDAIFAFGISRFKIGTYGNYDSCAYSQHSHSFIDSIDNHTTASGLAWCRRCMPPGNAVSGQSSTMCLVVWWIGIEEKDNSDFKPEMVSHKKH